MSPSDVAFVPGLMDGVPESIQEIYVTVAVSPDVITERTLLYEPVEKDIVAYRNPEHKTGRIRKIFLNTPLDDEEQQWLSKLRAYFKKGETELHPLLEKDYLRYLQHAKGDINATIKLLLANELFKKEFFCPLNDTEIMEGLQSGFMYWHGRDRNERPILVVRTAMLNPKMKPADIVRLVGFILEWMIKYGLVPGRVENWTVLVDLKDTGLRSFSLETIRTLVTTLHMNYRFRNTKVVIMNCPWIGSSIYKMISPLLPADTKEKVTFCSVKEAKTLLANLIDAHQFEEQFGGTASNCEKPEDFYPYRFFPVPQMPSVENKVPQEYLTGQLWEVHENAPPKMTEWFQKISISQLGTTASCCYLQTISPKAKGITPATKIEGHLKALNTLFRGSSAALSQVFDAIISKVSRRSIIKSYADSKSTQRSFRHGQTIPENTLSEALVAKRGGPTSVPEELGRIQNECCKQTEEETEAELVEMCTRITSLVNGGDVASAIEMIRIHGDSKEKAVTDGIALNAVSDAYHMVELRRHTECDNTATPGAIFNGEPTGVGAPSPREENCTSGDGVPSPRSPASGRGTPKQKPDIDDTDDGVARKGGCCGAGKSKKKKAPVPRPGSGAARQL
eukprot:GEMP01010532.1.p1 GENE.GEMP01010532.1~~GEMP01010532.1.p1  ORF type:complete len:621 (+),score=89.59 GEMP01010532.1:100-1962(+)